MFEPSGNLADYQHFYISDPGAPADGEVKVTFLGTTMLLIDDGSTQVLIDAFLTRPSFESCVAKTPLRTDPTIVDAALDRVAADRVAAVFIAHSHYDHVFDAAYIVERYGAQLHGSESTLNVGRGDGLRENQLNPFEAGGPTAYGDFIVTALHSKHSPQDPDNTDIGVTIDEPLSQPADVFAYTEGGSFDFLIEHGENTILVKPSANYIAGALDDIRAEALFLGTGTLGKQDDTFKNAYYDQTVAKIQPELVIPIHWDNFFTPLTDHLEAPMNAFDNLTAGFDFITERLRADGIRFGILQGFQSVILYGHD